MNLLLAIDLGKSKSVVCRHDRNGAVFQTVITCRAELTRLFRAHPGATVVIEASACGSAPHVVGSLVIRLPGWTVTGPPPSRRLPCSPPASTLTTGQG